MTVATAYAVLSNASAVTALVPADRITPLVRVQGIAVPSIVLQKVSAIPSTHLRGDGALDHNLIQLDVWDSDYTNAVAIAAACRIAMQAATHILTLQADAYDPDVDPELFRITQTWAVWT